MKNTSPDPANEGEGNVTAARRQRKSAVQFVASGQVPAAARAAAPKSAEEAQTLLRAEQKGLAKARK